MADDPYARIAQLEAELSQRDRALAEAREQQAATGEILGLIAASPLDVQRVLDAVAERAARLCDTYEALIHRVEGDVLPLAASYPPPGDDADTLPPTFRQASKMMAATGSGVPIAGSFSGRAVTERRTIHIHDSATVSEEEYPTGRAMHLATGQRTVLATPLLRHGVAIGAILLRRMEVRPFTAQQIALLETFAAQAAIAIDNSRMFRELERRNHELGDALARQTATAEVLREITGALTDARPVLDAVAESAMRLSGSVGVALWIREGDQMRKLAHARRLAGRSRTRPGATPGSPRARVAVDRRAPDHPPAGSVGARRRGRVSRPAGDGQAGRGVDRGAAPARERGDRDHPARQGPC